MKPSRRSRRSEGYNEKPEVVLSRKWRWWRKSAFLSTGPFVTCCQPRYLFKTHKKEVWPDYQVWKVSLHPSASSHPRSHSSHYLRGLRTLTPLFFFTFSSSLWETEKNTAHHFTYTYIYIYTHTYIFDCVSSSRIFSCSMWDLVSWLGSNLGPLHWESRALTPGPSGKSLP